MSDPRRLSPMTLARALGCRQDTVFAMLGYLTDTSHGDGYSVVAGWVAPVSAWEQIGIDWRLTLGSFDAPYFHMKEFAHSTGPFEKWRSAEGTRQDFIAALADVIRAHPIHGIVCVVGHDDMAAVDSEYELVEYFSDPYVLCAIQAMRSARSYRRREYADHDIAHILATGDPQQGRLVDICIELNEPTPVFKRPRSNADLDVDDPPLISLQTADFAAWDLNRAAPTLGYSHPLALYRQSLQLLGEDRVEWNHCTVKDLIAWCEQPQMRERTRRRQHPL